MRGGLHLDKHGQKMPAENDGGCIHQKVHSKIINNQSINQSIQLPSLKIEGIGYFSPSPSHRHHIAYSDWFAFSMRRQVGPDSLLSLEFISYIEPRKGEFSD